MCSELALFTPTLRIRLFVPRDDICTNVLICIRFFLQDEGQEAPEPEPIRIMLVCRHLGGGGRGQNALPPPPPNFVENNVGNNGPRDGENIVEIVENQHAAPPPNQPAAPAAGGRPNENARHDNAPADGRQDYHPRQYDNAPAAPDRRNENNPRQYDNVGVSILLIIVYQ